MTTTAPTRKLKRSVAALTGRIVVLPEHPSWDEARLAWNLAVDQQPAAVVFPESAEDVIAAVELARAFELRVTAQGTDHNAAPLGPLEDTVRVKTEPMRGIEIDPEARIARIDAGVRSVELVKAIPLGRVAETQELSDVITFLATPAASYINGAVIHVDGGRTAV